MTQQTVAPPQRRCRECGCTDWHACQTPEGPCRWVFDDLCSACAPAGVAA